jgi:RNA polymerase sigma-70 factor (ECF subfamily)
VTNQFENIFRQYYSPLCNYASKIVYDDVIAEDIVQSLFIQLWENKKLDKVEKIERFLLRAVKFKSIDYLRTKMTNTEILIEEIEDNRNIGELKEEEIEPLLYYYASKLPPKTREVFLLSRKSGLSYKEIAEEQGISVKTVENQMGNALKTMRKLLKEQDYLLLVLLLNCLQK